jgi:hypothetical protein
MFIFFEKAQQNKRNRLIYASLKNVIMHLTNPCVPKEAGDKKEGIPAAGTRLNATTKS